MVFSIHSVFLLSFSTCRLNEGGFCCYFIMDAKIAQLLLRLGNGNRNE